MSSREDFLKKMGLSEDDLRTPESKAASAAGDTRPVQKGEVPIDDSFIRHAALTDAEALKSSPNNHASKVAYREDQIKKFRETRNATITRELGLEDGVHHHDDLAQQGVQSHQAASSYKAQLLSDFRKKRNQTVHNTEEL